LAIAKETYFTILVEKIGPF